MKVRARRHPGALTGEFSERERAHLAIAAEAAAEGIVLLKNEDNILPIAAGSRIALYGAGAVRTIKGGTGSGDANSREPISVWQGLTEAGYIITSESWLKDYQEAYHSARMAWRQEILDAWARPVEQNLFQTYAGHPFRVPGGRLLREDEGQKGAPEVAFYVLSRSSGEAADRWAEPGDYYLTKEEESLLEQVCERYPHVVLILNTGGIVDLSYLERFTNIHGVLYMVQAGQAGGRALASVISGETVPSGKLTDTWAYDYEDYPASAYFGRRGNDAWTAEYREDIYVGYRYFDTFEVPARFSFGYGLSYTDFLWKLTGMECRGSKVSLQVKIQNAGKTYAGKEVVQVYASCPQTEIVGEFRRLVAFGKTGTVAPGEETAMTLTFGSEELEYYDEGEAAWKIRRGRYGIWIGDSLESAVLAGSIWIDKDRTLEVCSHICPQVQPIRRLEPNRARGRAREEFWLKLCEDLPSCRMEPDAIPERKHEKKQPKNSCRQLAMSLSEEQQTAMVTGKIHRGAGDLGNAGWMVPGSAAETENILEGDPWHVPGIVLADGPAGLRLKSCYRMVDGKPDVGTVKEALENGFFAEGPEKEGDYRWQYCTAIPVGILLAQTWDPDLVHCVGAMVAREMREFEVVLWLAPGMNIHRDPLCGRNFEYYSEDPLLTGCIAAAMTEGVQSVPGCGTTIKHLVCNNQEEKRKGSDSILGERALREIYLKGFEIAVKRSHPMSIMTSYNMINGVHAANSYDLCTTLVREEWGFEGIIMTDWTTTTTSIAGVCTASGCIAAGNDLIMPGCHGDRDNIREALASGELCREALVDCVERVIRICRMSHRMEDLL